MLQLLPWHSADKYLSHLAAILPESVGQVKQEPRRRGRVFSAWALGNRRADVGDGLGPRHRLDGDAGECGRRLLLPSGNSEAAGRPGCPGVRHG